MMSKVTDAYVHHSVSMSWYQYVQMLATYLGPFLLTWSVFSLTPAWTINYIHYIVTEIIYLHIIIYRGLKLNHVSKRIPCLLLPDQDTAWYIVLKFNLRDCVVMKNSSWMTPFDHSDRCSATNRDMPSGQAYSKRSQCTPVSLPFLELITSFLWI